MPRRPSASPPPSPAGPTPSSGSSAGSFAGAGALPGMDGVIMLDGIRRFLSGLGVDQADPELETTPERVVQAWRDEFLSGYAMDPVRILSDRYPAVHEGPVIVTGLRFISVCPHHLLPFEGLAHLAYVPGEHIVGLGRLSQLVDCFSRRLVLQETLTRQIPLALQDILGASGAACILSTRQSCMVLRGANQEHSQCTTAAWLGAFETDSNLQSLFLKSVPSSIDHRPS